MRSIIAVGLVVILAGCVQAMPSGGAWQVPAEGPPLNAGAVMQLAGKTCWGFFDKGINSENARGAVFIRFSPSPPIGDFWNKWGKEAQAAAQRGNPDGYDYVGKTTVAQLTPAGTEITFQRPTSPGNRAVMSFDWFIRPASPGNYAMRAVNSRDNNRGAVGELHCS